MAEEPFAELIGRLTSEFIGDVFSSAARLQNGSWESGAIALAVSQYNSGHVAADPDLHTQYASVHLDDHERRPISVAALARSLQLPRESVRRYTLQLVERGVLVRAGKDGLIVPKHYIMRPEVEAQAREIPIGFIDMLQKLDDVAYPFLSEELGMAPPPRPAGEFPIYFVARTAGAFLFRIYYEAMATSPNLLDFLIEQAVTNHNISELTAEEHHRFSVMGVTPPDRLRRPMAAAAIAQALGVSPSTAYRVIRRMVNEGRLSKSGLGYIVPNRVLQARAARVEQANTYFRAMIRSLQQRISVAEVIAAGPALKRMRHSSLDENGGAAA